MKRTDADNKKAYLGVRKEFYKLTVHVKSQMQFQI